MKNPFDRFASAVTIQWSIRDRQDALVREARALVNAKNADEVAHVVRLQRLGFTGVPEVRANESRLLRKTKMRSELERQEEYALKYPGFRFVSERIMDDVCAQYGLVIGGVDRYMGQVPAWAAKVVDESGVLSGRVWRVRYLGQHWGEFPTEDDIPERVKEDSDLTISHEYAHPLLIAAPKKNMRVHANEEIRNHRIVKRDPIVMIKVLGGYVVLAAWDEEGRDPRILNVGNN